MLNPHALIINLNTNPEEPYTVGAFTMVRSLKDNGVLTSYFDNLGIGSGFKDSGLMNVVFEKVIGKINPSTQFIGFSAINSNAKVSIELAYLIKEKLPSISIGFGGVFLESEHLFNEFKSSLEDFDFYIKGRGDQVIKKIIDWGFDSSKFTSLKGLSYRSENGFIHSDEKIVYEDYKPLSYSPVENDPNYAETSFSVGCPYRCSFCSQHFYYPNFIRSDLEECIEELKKHRGKHVFFTDALINNNHAWLRKLCIRMKEENLSIQWTSWFRVSRQMNDHEMINIIYESGCRVISFGLESASSSVLRHMKKFHDEKQIYQIFNKIRDLNKEGKNLVVKLNIIVGYPTETEEDFRKTYFFIKKNADIIAGVSVNPALVSTDLPVFKKMYDNGEFNYIKCNQLWETAHSSPEVRLERLEKLRKVLKASNIKFSIHNEDSLKEKVVKGRESQVLSEDEPNFWKRTFFSSKINPNDLRDFYLFPTLSETKDFFDYENHQIVMITSSLNFFSRLFGKSTKDKFEVEHFIENYIEADNTNYDVKREPVNAFIFLLLNRGFYAKNLEVINKFFGIFVPWLSFHVCFRITRR